MNDNELFESLIAATTTAAALKAVEQYVAANDNCNWVPLGGRDNNSGTVEAATNAGRALVERVTNAVDAVLEREHSLRNGLPICGSPREAAEAWLNVPRNGLSSLSTRDRQGLANNVHVQVIEGDSASSRIVQISDQGIGLSSEEMPKTILSLNESNKIGKHYLSGTYGQGGSATFALCQLTLIASRRSADAPIAFTIVEHQDRPAELFKRGWYVYLVRDGQLPSTTSDKFELKQGTVCRHYGYDLTKYKSPIGPNSVYGLLQQVLFDPIIPVWLEYRVAGWRRVIKGSRNALNGANDEGDDASNGGKTDHSARMFYISLGDFGRIGLEYWVLPAPEGNNSKPIASFVDPAKPIVLTYNGQNQAEMTARVVRKLAELPYLALRLICHVDCNSLTRDALRQLFASSREEARFGHVYDMIEAEVVRVLRSDERLTELNDLARDTLRHNRDESTKESMRKEVARLLRIQGFEVSQTEGGSQSELGNKKGNRGGKGARRKLEPIELKEPPSYFRIVSPDEQPIKFYPGQRRYVRLETDAHSRYHDPTRPDESKVAILTTGFGFRCAGTTALENGRMRAFIDCADDVTVGASGTLRIELRPAGTPTLSDQRDMIIVEAPRARDAKQRIQLPPFDVRPVEGSDDPLWGTLDWPENTSTVASSSLKEDGQLVVYYSTVFPRFVEFRGQFESKDQSLASSFVARYEIWLAVHSLILEEDEQHNNASGAESIENEDETAERAERCRMATLAAMFAAREVQSDLSPDISD